MIIAFHLKVSLLKGAFGGATWAVVSMTSVPVQPHCGGAIDFSSKDL